MKEKLNQLLKDVDNSYNMALIKLPMTVRKMVWLEHCSKLSQIHISFIKTIFLKEPLKKLSHRHIFCNFF